MPALPNTGESYRSSNDQVSAFPLQGGHSHTLSDFKTVRDRSKQIKLQGPETGKLPEPQLPTRNSGFTQKQHAFTNLTNLISPQLASNSLLQTA